MPNVLLDNDFLTAYDFILIFQLVIRSQACFRVEIAVRYFDFRECVCKKA